MSSGKKREYDKINFETNVTDPKTIWVLLNSVKENEPLNKDKARDGIFAQAKRNVGMSVKKDKDTHGANTLKQYELIEYDGDDIIVSELGEKFLSVYELNKSNVEMVLSKDEFNNIVFEMINSWHITKNNRSIHPGELLFRLMTDKDLNYYITDNEWAYITSNQNIASDYQYEYIKSEIIKFRIRGGWEYNLKKSDVFLRAFWKTWKIFDMLYRDYREEEDLYSTNNLVEPEDDIELDVNIEDDDIDVDTDTEEDDDENTINKTGKKKKYKKTYFTLTEDVKKLAEEYLKEKYNDKPYQKIYFGAPGTGKSYQIEEELKGIDESQISRVTFHPEYSYGDFVGFMRPIRKEIESKGKSSKSSNNTEISYEFIPGPFTLLLEKALENPTNKYYLIIEEINRGSTASIIGDIFQLLDRNLDGESKYETKNIEIVEYLKKNEKIAKIFVNDAIRLPFNFNILATMNTGDQNVFILDTAFKRRFEMEYIPLIFSNIKHELTIETDVFKQNKKSLEELFEGSNIEDYITKLSNEGKLKRNWVCFANIVNYIIDKINEEEGIEQISLDKKLGPYFVTVDDINDRKKFVNKVIYYLKNDIFRYTENYMTMSFDKIYYNYVIDDKNDIFELLK